jgi:hypothetical protein
MSIRVTQIRRPPRELLMTERRLSPFQRAMLRWCRRTPSSEVGRQESTRLALLETCAWLEAHGWAGTDRGWLQCYSLWLLERRDDYARTGGE